MRRVLASLVPSTLSAIAGLLLLYLLLALSWPLSSSVSGAIATGAQRAQTQLIAPVNIASATNAAILITSTLGTNPHECATTDVITVSADTSVIYCYTVVNTGDVTFTHHTISNASLGFSVPLPYTLTPLGGPLPSFFFTVAAPVTTSLINKVIWVAKNENAEQAVAEDEVRVVVPAIVVTHTVGTDPHSCATTRVIQVMAGTAVTHCYWVTNRGETTFQLHTAVDSHQGLVVADWPFVLAPQESVWLTATDLVTATHTSIVTWTAIVSDNLYATDVSRAVVRIPAMTVQTTVGYDEDHCAEDLVITATVGDKVTYCYQAINTGGIDLFNLTVQDTILDDEPYVLTQTLPANNVLRVRVSAPVSQNTTNTVIWHAQTAEGLPVTSTTTAQVTALSRIVAIAFYDVNRENGREPLEPGVPGGTVTLTSAAGPAVQALTDEQGYVNFPALPDGQYTVTAATGDLEPEYSIESAHLTQSIVISTPAIYTRTFALYLPDESDLDQDGIPDYLEGVEDDDGDLVPNYLDADLYFYLPLIRQQ
jgi:hypothetical protein